MPRGVSSIYQFMDGRDTNERRLGAGNIGTWFSTAFPGQKGPLARGKDLLYPPSMTPPTMPIASSSKIKPKKLKKPSEKSRKENAASLNAEAASAVIGISNRNEAPVASSTPPVAADSSVPTDYYGDVEFGEFDYDAVNADEHAELWLVRAPTAVRFFFNFAALSATLKFARFPFCSSFF
jgi:hypothetical protein